MAKPKTEKPEAEKPETLTNEAIAEHLEQIAEYLSLQDANPHRVRAYHSGAKSVRTAEQAVGALVEAANARGDTSELEALPNIGQGLAWLISELVKTGGTERLRRLRGDMNAGAIFRRVPGVGPVLAQRVIDTLGIDTLAELEMAAHDGRLRTVEGFGPERVQAVRDSVATMLTRAGSRRRNQRSGEKPAVATLLAVDKEYRRAAEAGELQKITPRRFNPKQEAWLPILHTEADGWDFTVLFSNTSRAHELDKTDDWVVMYYDRDDDRQDNEGQSNGAQGNGHDGQCTVVTETTGPLKGQRVVRGRERECREYYDKERA